MEKIQTQCCIAGGGPAGIMLGYMLARAGINVVVLEKWPDFFRDFRGDTIHPSTMEILFELGLLEDFLKLPHQEIVEIRGGIGDEEIPIAEFGHMPGHCKFLGFIPQWDFLNFLTSKAKQFSSFRLMMQTEATDLIRENNKVVGVKATGEQNQFEIYADLVIGADGRHSVVREKAGLRAVNLGAPMDVLWFRIPRLPTDPVPVLGRLARGKMMIMIDRGDYWQCGFVIAKGGFDKVKASGLEKFREDIYALAPFTAGRDLGIADFDSVKLLTVTVDRLRQWYAEGLLCIGDAAHAMSPIGGVGINLAIQDAVAAANILIPKFKQGAVQTEDLAAVQKRRQLPTQITQRTQLFIQNHVIFKVLNNSISLKVPWPLKLLRKFAYLRRIPARIVGLGFRPEHVSKEIRDRV